MKYKPTVRSDWTIFLQFSIYSICCLYPLHSPCCLSYLKLTRRLWVKNDRQEIESWGQRNGFHRKVLNFAWPSCFRSLWKKHSFWEKDLRICVCCIFSQNSQMNLWQFKHLIIIPLWSWSHCTPECSVQLKHSSILVAVVFSFVLPQDQFSLIWFSFI